MLNHTYNDNSTHSVVMNPPCVGTLQKSHPRSKFVRFHKGSNYASWVFSEIPRLTESTREGYVKEIVVLQVMVFGDNEILVEYVSKSDWEKEQ